MEVGGGWGVNSTHGTWREWGHWGGVGWGREASVVRVSSVVLTALEGNGVTDGAHRTHSSVLATVRLYW